MSSTAADYSSDLCHNSSVDIDTSCNVSLLCNENQASVQQPLCDRVDDLMRMAYGETLLYFDGGPHHSHGVKDGLMLPSTWVGIIHYQKRLHRTAPHATVSYDDQLSGAYHTPFEHYNPTVA